MIQYKVEITGPGSCINNILAVIQHALITTGYNVFVTNDCPIENMSSEELLAWIKSNHHDNEQITIRMNHLPWGG